MADSTSESFHSSPDETNQPLPLQPQQEAHASLTSFTSQSSEENRQRKVGRPRGSKNKPKPSGIISQEIESAIKTVQIEIPYGYNIVEAIEKFARHHRVGVNVENGSGFISNISFVNSTMMSSGVFKLTHMSGTFVDCSIMDSPSSSSTGGEFSSFPYFGPWLRIGCMGAEEKLFAGIVAKNVMVYSNVAVVHVTTFKSCGAKALDPAEYSTEGQQPVDHGGGYFVGSSSSSVHPSSGGVGDSAGGLLGGVLGGRTQQQNWGFLVGGQPMQHEGLFGGSSNLGTHPSGGGFGGVAESAGRILGAGGNSGVLDSGTQQQNWGDLVGEQPVQHEGGLFDGSSNLSTLPSGGGLGRVGESTGEILGGGGNSGVSGGGTQQQNWDFLVEEQPMQDEGGLFGGSSNLSTHPNGGGLGGVGESTGGILGGGGNSGVLGGGAQQQNWDFPVEEQSVQHEAGLFGGFSNFSTHPSGGGLGGVGDFAGGIVGGGGNSGALGGRTQQQNWGYLMAQPMHHGGGHFGGQDGSSGLSTHPSGGGLGGVGESVRGLLGGGGNGGVLGGGTQQQNMDFFIEQQPVQHAGGLFGGSSSLSTHLSGGGLGGVGDSSGGFLSGDGNSGVIGRGAEQRNWGFMMGQQPVQHGGEHFGGSSGLNTHPSGGGLGEVGDLAGGGQNGGVLGGGSVLIVPTQQLNGLFLTEQQPVQHEGGRFGGSSSLGTQPGGRGLGEVGDSGGGLLGGALGGGAGLGVPSEQLEWDMLMGDTWPPG